MCFFIPAYLFLLMWKMGIFCVAVWTWWAQPKQHLAELRIGCFVIAVDCKICSMIKNLSLLKKQAHIQMLEKAFLSSFCKYSKVPANSWCTDVNKNISKITKTTISTLSTFFPPFPISWIARLGISGLLKRSAMPAFSGILRLSNLPSFQFSGYASLCYN